MTVSKARLRDRSSTRLTLFFRVLLSLRSTNALLRDQSSTRLTLAFRVLFCSRPCYVESPLRDRFFFLLFYDDGVMVACRARRR